MNKLNLFLVLLFAALQYRLWVGDGGIHEYRATQARLSDMRREGERRAIRNTALKADVNDLREGAEAIDEMARRELGMIKPGETFVQVYEKNPEPNQARPVIHIVNDVSIKTDEDEQPSQKKPSKEAASGKKRHRPHLRKSPGRSGTTPP